MVSVGALNPNRTIALFSNAGDWVTCHRPGAALVSTFPITFDASGLPLARVYVPGEGWRETVDPDNFRSRIRDVERDVVLGADPGRRDRRRPCVSGDCGPIDDVDRRVDASTRAWQAIEKTVGSVTRP